MEAPVKRLLTIPLLLVALLTLPAASQQSAQTATSKEKAAKQTSATDSSSEETPFVASINVSVINVDVEVTDRKGNHITGLKKDDFEIYENGRPQPVTNFYEVKQTKASTSDEGKPAAPEQEKKTEPVQENFQRRIVFFIDNVSLAPFNRNRVFTAMKSFAKETMRPGDEAEIVTWNRSMKVRVPFTNDAEQIQETLDTISGESALGTQYMSERRSIEDRIRNTQDYGSAIALARSWAEEVQHDVRQAGEAVNSLINTMGGLQGKKILVLTTQGFQLQPGMEMFHFIDDVGRTNTTWGGARSVLMEGYSYDSTSLIQGIASNANANNVTLYTIHAGGLVGMVNSSAQYAEPVSPQVEQFALQNSTDSLKIMAEQTGGLAIVGSNNFKAGFDSIKRDLDNYYSLGYRAGTERVDRKRTIEVRLRDPKLRRLYTVRSRRSFVEKSVGTEMSDRVIANIFNPTGRNDLGIFLTTGRPASRDDGTYLVTVDVHIPLKNLTLLPEGDTGKSRGKFSIWIVAADNDGNQSDVHTQAHAFTMATKDLKDVGEKYYTYSMDLILSKGRNRISVGALDNVSQERGFEQTEVLAMDLR